MSQKLKGKKDKNDPSRFEGEGVNFRAKLIGIDDVEAARGDQMCQDSLQKLKAIVKASGEHKQRIIVNVSLEGLTLIDEKTKAINHNHAVHRISFISRDVSDNRAFGYIYGTGDGTHKFFAIKTLQAAELLVLTLRDLFQCVYELKKQEMEDVKNKQEGGENSETPETAETEQKEGGESIYQVPTNGAPVEGKEGESIYQVPGSNEPVNSDEPDSANLVDLENELQSLQAFMKDAEEINRQLENGIQQIDTFEDLFSGRQSGDGAVDIGQKNDPWGAPTSAADSSPFGDSFGAVSTASSTSTSSDLFDTAFSTPASTQSTFPTATTAAADPFSTQLSQLGISTTASSPFSLSGPPNAQRSASPFGASFNPAQTTVNPMTGFGAPQMQAGFGQSQFGGGVAPPSNQSLFGVPNTQQTPFGMPPVANPMAGGMFGAPANPAMGFPPSQQAPANPFSAGGFAPPTQAPPMQAANLFDTPVMMPSKGNNLAVPQETEAKPRSGSDLFGDLCGIGPTVRKGKTPKDLFEEQKNEPKKSLNELKPVPTATPAQASSTDFSKTNGFHEFSDHFDSFSFPSGNSKCSTDPFHPHKPSLNGADFLSPKSPTSPPIFPLSHFNGGSMYIGASDDFDLPFPVSPPPPLPRDKRLNQPPPTPPRPGSIARPRPGKTSITTSVSQQNGTNNHSPNVFNFAVANPFDDPFFTGGNSSASTTRTVIKQDKSSVRHVKSCPDKIRIQTPAHSGTASVYSGPPLPPTQRIQYMPR